MEKDVVRIWTPEGVYSQDVGAQAHEIPIAMYIGITNPYYGGSQTKTIFTTITLTDLTATGESPGFGLPFVCE